MYDVMSEREKALMSRVAMDPLEGQEFATKAEKQQLAQKYAQSGAGVEVDPKPVGDFTGTTEVQMKGQMGANLGAGLSGAGEIAGKMGGGSSTGNVLSSTLAGAGAGAATGAAMGAAGGPWGAVIGAGVGLVAGLFDDKAQREAERRQRIIESLKVESQQIQQAQRQLQVGTQQGINTQLTGYSRALS